MLAAAAAPPPDPAARQECETVPERQKQEFLRLRTKLLLLSREIWRFEDLELLLQELGTIVGVFNAN